MSETGSVTDTSVAPIRGRFSLQAQIAETDYELRQCERVYRRLVQARKMTQSEADYHSGAMRAVRNTLQWLKEHETAIRAAIAAAAATSEGNDGGRAGKTEL